MRVKFSSLLITVIVVVFAATAVQAQAPKKSLSVTLGDKVVLFPSPEGFEEASSQWEVVKTRFSASVPPDGDLLGGYLPVSECDLLRKGQPAPYRSWVIVSIYRPARNHVSSREEFARLIGYAEKEGENLMSPDLSSIKQGLSEMDKVLSKEYSKDIKLDLGKPKLLGNFDRRPDVYSNLLMMNLTVRADEKEAVSTPVLAALTMLLVKQRIVGIYTYRKYESETDGDILMKFTTKWLNEILAAN